MIESETPEIENYVGGVPKKEFQEPGATEKFWNSVKNLFVPPETRRPEDNLPPLPEGAGKTNPGDRNEAQMSNVSDEEWKKNVADRKGLPAAQPRQSDEQT